MILLILKWLFRNLRSLLKKNCGACKRKLFHDSQKIFTWTPLNTKFPIHPTVIELHLWAAMAQEVKWLTIGWTTEIFPFVTIADRQILESCSFSFKGQWELFPRTYSTRSVKLIMYLYFMQGLIIRKMLPPCHISDVIIQYFSSTEAQLYNCNNFTHPGVGPNIFAVNLMKGKLYRRRESETWKGNNSGQLYFLGYSHNIDHRPTQSSWM
jgi:hypothetical protein